MTDILAQAISCLQCIALKRGKFHYKTIFPETKGSFT